MGQGAAVPLQVSPPWSLMQLMLLPLQFPLLSATTSAINVVIITTFMPGFLVSQQPGPCAVAAVCDVLQMVCAHLGLGGWEDDQLSPHMSWDCCLLSFTR